MDKKYNSTVTSNILRNATMRRWLRDRVKKETVSNSVNSLVEDKESQSTRSKSQVIINPEYLYSKLTMDKIIQIKNIFYEFDSNKNSIINIIKFREIRPY